MTEYIVSSDRPDCLAHLAPDAHFFDFFLPSGELIANMGFEVNHTVAVMHIIVHRFSPAVLKHLKKYGTPFLFEFCIIEGCKTMLAPHLPDSSDEEVRLWSKFVKHFGFGTPKRVYIAMQEV